MPKNKQEKCTYIGFSSEGILEMKRLSIDPQARSSYRDYKYPISVQDIL